MTGISWSITGVWCDPQAGGVVDFVTYLEWQSYCQDTGLSRSGDQSFSPNPLRVYRDGADLTEDDMLGWVWARLDRGSIDTDLETASIAALKAHDAEVMAFNRSRAAEIDVMRAVVSTSE